MVFSSLIFLFGFLVVYLAVYFLAPEKYRNQVLLVASLVFYAWSGPKFLLVLLGESLISWFCALRVARAKDKRGRRIWLVVDIVGLLGLLAYFKYAVWIMGNFQFVFGVPELIPTIVLPIGISFYTFQLITYVADVYWGKVKPQPAYWKVLLYASMFFQCIAGPIVRYDTIANEIDNRRITSADVFLGVRRFCIGLAKKAVLANSCAEVADTLLPIGTDALWSEPTAALWLGMLFYMLQIYFDFSAYSDMAIGMGQMVGFHFLENFNYPYMCKSIQDFWRRWHISLSTFFRDYVYIPLGGSRCSSIKIVRNMTVVWFLTGLWHGASWNYILWGLYFLVFLLFERFVLKGRLPSFVGHVYSLVVVYFGWVLFKFEDFAELGHVLASMFGLGGVALGSLEVQTLFLQNVFLLAFCIVACTDVGQRIHRWLFRMAKRGGAWFVLFNVTELVTPIALLLLSVVVLTGASYNPFIYFQF